MTWQDILKKILLYTMPMEQVTGKVLGIEELKSYVDFRTLDFSKFHYDFAVTTDSLAEYHPATSEIKSLPLGSKITYDIEKIVFYADRNLHAVCESLGLGTPCEDLIKIFRWGFFHAVRRHAIFHYLVERACKLLAENRYGEYRAKLYDKRKEMGLPILEEALADAYAIVYVDIDLRTSQSTLPLSSNVSNDLIIALKKWIRAVFTHNSRPQEYSLASRFISEFESLREIENNPEEIKKLMLYSTILRGGRALDGVFRGLSWLFHEITVVEPIDFIDKKTPPKPPYPIKDFLVFLENFRKDDTIYTVVLLPPAEEIKPSE